MLKCIAMGCVLLIAGSGKLTAKDSLLSVQTDFICFSEKKILQDVFFILHAPANVSLRLECYRYVPGKDSVLVARTQTPARKLKKGTGHIEVAYNGKEYKGYLQASFSEVLQRTGIVPPGVYKTYLTLSTDSMHVNRVFYHEIDSTLPHQSVHRRDMNRLLRDARPAATKGRHVKGGQVQADKASVAFPRSKKSMDRHFRKKGIIPVYHARGDKEVVELHYGNWFLGRYEMDTSASVSETVAKEDRALSTGSASLTNNNLGSYQSLFSQMRSLRQDRKDHEEIEGVLSWGSFLSNDQEEFSQLDNNYHELYGSVELPVFDLPVTFEGFYTTQDRNREAKAGYVRMRYDAAKSKDKLLQLINGYKQRYAQTDARGSGYQMIYGQFLGQAKAEQAKAMERLKREADITDLKPGQWDADALREKAQAQAEQRSDRLQDSLSGEGKGSDAGGKARQAADRYKDWEQQYERIMALEQQISRYEGMLEQYERTRRFDSLLAYDKLKDLEDVEGMSYKDLSKRADRILPEGKSKKFVTGITSIDLGMFPKHVSGYTMAGQRMTGIDVGYDVGPAEIGVQYGKTEYVNRDGTMEDYTAYGARVMMKPVAKQQVGLVYYGYTPGRKLLNESGFFKSTDVSLPSFREPVHIVSLLYRNDLSRYVSLNGEYAVSRRQGQTLTEGAKQTGLNDQSAYNVNLTGQIPKTSVSVEAGYEHTGHAFENNTLPVIMTGTDRYRAAARGNFFRSFLTLGVEYNYMQQKSFRYKGGNSRWGFDVQTHSRRYPSVYVSYKPFATFRAFDDTLQTPQKPMLGAVWTGRVSYQVKRPGHSWRFVALYNRNSSIADTISYASTLAQFTTIYTRGRQNVMLNAGSTHIQGDMGGDAHPAFNNTRFGGVTAGSDLGSGFDVSAGAELGFTPFGLSRYSGLLAIMYRLPKMPLNVRGNFRYTNYKLNEAVAWKPLYAGGLELIWQFRRQLKNRT